MKTFVATLCAVVAAFNLVLVGVWLDLRAEKHWGCDCIPQVIEKQLSNEEVGQLRNYEIQNGEIVDLFVEPEPEILAPPKEIEPVDEKDLPYFEGGSKEMHKQFPKIVIDDYLLVWNDEKNCYVYDGTEQEAKWLEYRVDGDEIPQRDLMIPTRNDEYFDGKGWRRMPGPRDPTPDPLPLPQLSDKET